jgi:Family of unknown function (DUF6492)
MSMHETGSHGDSVSPASLKEHPSRKTARPALDLVIKTRWQDATTYLRLQKDLLKHCGIGGRVYVIVPQLHRRYFRRLVAEPFILISSEEILEASGYRSSFADTWVTQQILKLLAYSIVPNDQFLVLDSNTLLGFDFDEEFFWRKSRYVYGIGDFSDVAWELQSRNLLKVEQPSHLLGFRAVNQIFIKQNVRALLDHLECLYGDDAVATLLRNSDPQRATNWTEFTLYGVFCQCVLPEPNYHFEARRDLLSFSFGMEFEKFLIQVEKERPLMIKFYKRRPTYLISDTAYKRYVAQIKQRYARTR